MVNSFSMRNFRCFRDAEVDGCTRVNVVVGDNGAGKTSLLEGLFLVRGVSPELAVSTRSWRGLEGVHLSAEQADIWDALFSDLFFAFDTNKQALISMKGKQDENRSVTIQMQNRTRPPSPRRDNPSVPPQTIPLRSPIRFIYKLNGEVEDIVEPEIRNSEISFTKALGEHVNISLISANRPLSHQETLSQFSHLSQHYSDAQFVTHFSKIYPSISGISVEIAGGSPVLCASITGLPKKIPLSLMSSGITKLVSILLSITKQAGGIVLIDELENGFHYSHLSQIWESLLSFPRHYDCQLFISTHSHECLSFAAEFAKRNPTEFAVIRVAMKKNEAQIRILDGYRFVNAVEENIEIR